MVKFPGLIDPHVHLREPGATHKEDWESGTKAAAAGGFTMLLVMPNTEPPITDVESLDLVESSARKKAIIDYGHFLGAGFNNAQSVAEAAPRAAGLKMYLDQTYGSLRLDKMSQWLEHFKLWPGEYPIAVHAEGRSLAAVLLLSALFEKSIHVCHVSRREEILLIREAKRKGLKVTCEVAPHHLFLTTADIPPDAPGMGEVRPRLANSEDQESLWDNLDVIDCFATDHAPHTIHEKLSPNSPPGFPGLETALSLFLNAETKGRLTYDDIILRMYTNPKKIYKLPDQENTWIEINPDLSWEVKGESFYSRSAWTPFEGWHLRGRVTRVVLRKQVLYQDEELIAEPGTGLNVRSKALDSIS
jgi:carbamoyl-phosphate synthase/aspartate carbamoyltransferase/dihydroorotase